MFKFLCVLISFTLFCLVQKVTAQYMDVPHIACPQYFEYLCYGSICIGKITLNNVQLGTTNINVEFSQRSPVQQNNYGSLSLFEDKDATIEKIKRGESISYRVDFPLSNVLPKLTKIVVNGALLCQSSGYPPPSTTITQQHTLTASVYTTYNSVPYTIYNEPIGPEQTEYGFPHRQQPRPQPTRQRPKPRPKQKPLSRPQSASSKSRPSMQSFGREPTVDYTQYHQQQQNSFYQPNERFGQTEVQQIPQPSILQTREPIQQPNFVQSTEPTQQISQPNFIQTREPFQQVSQYGEPNIQTGNPFLQTQQPNFIQTREPFQTAVQQIPQRGFIPSGAPNSQSNSQAYCGREGVTPSIVPFISGGTILRPGQFPWLTAIYHKSVVGTSFLCGGSLISARTILSAAHCFQLTQLTADKVSVTLGRYNLSNSMETTVVTRDIKSLLINPEYDPNMFPDADVALLLMSAPVSFTEFIRPICLWSGPEDSSLIVNESGYVAGWGGDEQGNAISAIPKMAPANIVSETVCRQSSDLLKILTTSRTLCAGQQDGVGPCMGDSGGGLMIQRNGVWQLRGIVSAGHSEKQRCNLRQYVVYCDVAKFSSWVHSSML